MIATLTKPQQMPAIASTDQALTAIEAAARAKYGDKWIAGIVYDLAEAEEIADNAEHRKRMQQIRPGIDRLFKGRNCTAERLFQLAEVVGLTIEIR
jgi:hypothetical protein